MSVFSNRSIDPPDERSRYAGAILDLLGNQDPLSVLRRTPSALTRSIAGLTRDQLRQPEAPAKWSLVQVLQHLADSDLVWGWRVRMILTHDRPQITGYDQDLWAERLNYADADPDEALALFNLLRRANLKLVERATPADLKRVGIHSERGEESIEYLLRLYAGHDALHLRQIDRIRAAIGLPPQGESAGETFVQRYVKAFGSCDYAALDELYDEDVVFYTPLAWGRADANSCVTSFASSTPDIRV